MLSCLWPAAASTLLKGPEVEAEEKKSIVACSPRIAETLPLSPARNGGRDENATHIPRESKDSRGARPRADAPRSAAEGTTVAGGPGSHRRLRPGRRYDHGHVL